MKADIRLALDCKGGAGLGCEIASRIDSPLRKVVAGVKGFSELGFLPLVSGRYPRIEKDGTVHLSPGPLRTFLFYSVYYLEGKREAAEQKGREVKNALKEESSRVMQLAVDVKNELLMEFGGTGNEFSVIVTGDYSRSLGTGNILRTFVDLNDSETKKWLCYSAPVLHASDADIRVVTINDRLAEEARLIAERIEKEDGRDLFHIRVFSMEQVCSWASDPSSLEWLEKVWFKDLLHGKPVPGDVLYSTIRKELFSQTPVKDFWRYLIREGAKGSLKLEDELMH